ncbi:hypothetical protein T484DRAFT_1813918 [Baffinella frigidus]|nr:hypothetical protein T484DRAFT_1813918 [Cryptophyta sp. CCMP2293]
MAAVAPAGEDATATEAPEGDAAASMGNSLDDLLTGTTNQKSSRESKAERVSAEAGLERADKPAFLSNLEKDPITGGAKVGGLWKNDGSHAPPVEYKPAPVELVGDGGNSWKARQLKRLKERAETEGKTLQEIAESRADSLQDLEKAELKDRHAPKQRRQPGAGDFGGSRRSYLDDVGGNKDKQRMMMPKGGGAEGLKWKDKGGKREEERRMKEDLWDRTGASDERRPLGPHGCGRPSS